MFVVVEEGFVVFLYVLLVLVRLMSLCRRIVINVVENERDECFGV